MKHVLTRPIANTTFVLHLIIYSFEDSLILSVDFEHTEFIGLILGTTQYPKTVYFDRSHLNKNIIRNIFSEEIKLNNFKQKIASNIKISYFYSERV